MNLQDARCNNKDNKVEVFTVVLDGSETCLLTMSEERRLEGV